MRCCRNNAAVSSCLVAVLLVFTISKAPFVLTEKYTSTVYDVMLVLQVIVAPDCSLSDMMLIVLLLARCWLVCCVEAC
jgi:hypothetical protein